MNKIELLAPAGDFSKLKTAFLFGADAAYLGGDAFGLRANAGNFSDGEITEAVKLAESLGRKIYVTMNIIARDRDLSPMLEYADFLQKAGVHGVIVADVGVFLMLRERFPGLPLHVSTQANNLNSKTIGFFLESGAERVNLARELSLDEIAGINQKLLTEHPELPGRGVPYLEAFVHGAMCMAFSGRCMLSDYLAGRSSNRGDCAQPCRWNYAVSEEKRPGEYYPIVENDRGTFLFNSKDLCMLEYIPELASCGVGSLKIEGRMKSEFYTATVVRAYRIALDAYEKDPEGYKENKELLGELMKELLSVSHRDYTTGFYLGGRAEQIYSSSSYVRNTDFIGIADGCEKIPGKDSYELRVIVKGPFSEGDVLEILTPDSASVPVFTVTGLRDDARLPLKTANIPMMKVFSNSGFYVRPGSMIRRRKA